MRRGVWLEVVTLVVPGLNNSDEELGRLSAFLAGVSPDIPWHVTAFHPDYRMTDRAGTTPDMLLHAAAIGKHAGLRFVYAGNAAGQVGTLENTVCPGCGETLVERRAVLDSAPAASRRKAAAQAASAIPGRWRERGPAS